MRILYAITRSEWGGAQAHLFELIKDQKARNNDIHVVVGDEGEFSDRINKIAGVKLYVQKSLVRELNPLKDLTAIRDFRRLIKKINPNIVHLHSSKAGAIGRLASVGLNIKVIFTAHGWAFTEGVSVKKQFVFKFIEKFLARFTDRIICVSKYDYDLAVRKKVVSKNKMSVIYNGVYFSDFERKYNLKKEKLDILMVARFDDPKNQCLLLESFAKLPQEKFHLTLVGDGNLIEKVKDRAKELKISDNITFTGFKSNVIPYLKKADIFTLISNYEGLPISIIEAMSFSLPVVASNVGGIAEEIDNKVNGFLVPNNEQDIVNAFIEVSKKLNVMGQRSLSKFVHRFTLENTLKEINDVYIRILN